MFARPQSYEPALEALNRIDCDVITFETCASGGMDLAAIGKRITGKKIAIGVIDHHTLQVETPDDVATLIRRALEHIPAERLVIASDCGMGREGMSRRHAFFKMVALVLGTNIVRRELGAKEAPCWPPTSASRSWSGAEGARRDGRDESSSRARRAAQGRAAGQRFPPGRGAAAGAGTGRDAAAHDLSLARPLHAAPDERDLAPAAVRDRQAAVAAPRRASS